MLRILTISLVIHARKQEFAKQKKRMKVEDSLGLLIMGMHLVM